MLPQIAKLIILNLWYVFVCCKYMAILSCDMLCRPPVVDAMLGKHWMNLKFLKCHFAYIVRIK